MRLPFYFLLAVLLILLALLAGCATTRPADNAPPPAVVQVSTPCEALAGVPEYPEIAASEALKALGQSCKGGDQAACAQAVYTLGRDRERLRLWSEIAQVAIQGCGK